MQKSIANIFINSTCNGLPFEDAKKKAMQASKLFNEVLEFSQVTTFLNEPRHKIVEQLAELKELSKRFTAETEKKLLTEEQKQVFVHEVKEAFK